MIEGFLKMGRRGKETAIFLPVVCQEATALWDGSGVLFSDSGGGWYEIRKMGEFRKTRELYVIRSGETDQKALSMRSYCGIHLDKFNCQNFCKEDYEEQLEKEKGKESVYLGKISIGKVLIKLKLEGQHNILAQFFVLDEDAYYDETEDGRPYDYTLAILLEGAPLMPYESFIEMAKCLFAECIRSGVCARYQRSEKILHQMGERIYIDGEVNLDGEWKRMQSAATVLQEETFADRELFCEVDDRGDQTPWSGKVPISSLASPFLSGYFHKIQTQPVVEREGTNESLCD